MSLQSDIEKVSLFDRIKNGWFIRALEAGTDGYDKKTKRRLMLCNIMAYLIFFASLHYALLYAVADFEKFKYVILTNIFISAVALFVPLLHRHNDYYGAILIAITEYVLLFYLVSSLGRNSGIQINYIIGAALPFLICDFSRVRIIFIAVLAGFVCHLLAWFLFPPEAATIQADEVLLANLYVSSVITTFVMISIITLYAFQLVNSAEAQNDYLLRNILPDIIADRLKENPNKIIADNYDKVTVLFSDLVGFTTLSKTLPPTDLLTLLNDIFSHFDQLADKYGLEKIKTIGDAYMLVAGLPNAIDEQTEKTIKMALEMQQVIEELSHKHNVDLELRIGIHVGPLMAGVIGSKKFSYDVWGHTVNFASRLESHGKAGKIHISQSIKDDLPKSYEFESNGTNEIKGIGRLETWFIKSEYQLEESPTQMTA